MKTWGMEVGQLHVPATISSEKQLPFTTGQETGRAEILLENVKKEISCPSRESNAGSSNVHAITIVEIIIQIHSRTFVQTSIIEPLGIL
jgi:hypothetical protein